MKGAFRRFLPLSKRILVSDFDDVLRVLLRRFSSCDGRRYSGNVENEVKFRRCYVVEDDVSGETGNWGVCRLDARLGQRCGETGGVGLGVFGADPAVSRQLLPDMPDLPIVCKLVLLLLQATAPDRSTLDTALEGGADPV